MSTVAGAVGYRCTPLLAALACACVGPPPLAASVTTAAPGSVISFQDTLVLSPEQALQRAMAARPDLVAAQAELDAALGRRRQAGGYPFNPQLQAKAADLVDPGNLGALELILTQEIEWGGQGALRRGAADALVEAARYDLVDARRRAWGAVLDAHYAAVAAQRRYDIRRRGAELGRSLARSVDLQLAEGQVSTLERNLAHIQTDLALSAELRARGARDAAVGSWAGEVGLERGQAARPVSDTRPVEPQRVDAAEDWISAALRDRADLSALASRAESARLSARLVRRMALPNPTLAGVATRNGAAEDMRLGVRVGVPLPLWNRRGGDSDAASAEAMALEARRQEMALAVRTQVETALARWQAAQDAVSLLDEGVAGEVAESHDMIESAYREGQIDLPATLLLRAQLLEAELARVDAWLAERLAATAFMVATGMAPDRAPP